MSHFDQARYEKARDAAHEFYKSVSCVDSPLLGKVTLASEGFMHLIYGDRAHHNKRNWKNQLARFAYLKDAVLVLRKMPYAQEYTRQLETVEQKMNKRRETVMKHAEYYAFIALVGLRRVKVIVRREGEGQWVFWSVFPAMKLSGYRELADLAQQ